MENPIRIPRNLTACMQHMQRLVSAGHYLWTADQIPTEKLGGFISKWSEYGLRADAPARAYRKSKGRASVHLCIHPDFDWATENTMWWMLSSDGKAGLCEPATPGYVRDCRRAEERLQIKDYELVQQTKIIRSGNKLKRLNTWTWRLTNQRYLAWEALLIEQARSADRKALQSSIECLRLMPMFSGIRGQAIRLLAESNKMLAKLKRDPIETPVLPVMRMLKLWDEDCSV